VVNGVQHPKDQTNQSLIKALARQQPPFFFVSLKNVAGGG
jgi:hypothetical protein